MNTQINSIVPIRQDSPLDNALLNFLPYKYSQQLSRHLTLTTMCVGEIVLSQERALQYLYFPTTCIFSRNYIMKDGTSTAVAMIGREGLAGVSQLMGGDSPTCEVVVLSEGCAFRIKKYLLKAEFDKNKALQHVLLLYTQALLTQISQNIICNRYHLLEQKFCRWLLLCIDRLDTNFLHMTHEQIALNLGVRRETVTEVAHKLHKAGIIHCRRRLISVLNRHKLEGHACECYSVVQHEYNRLYELIGDGTSRKSLHLATPARKTISGVL